MPPIARGFQGRRPADPSRLPPGQYETPDFPVLAVGPTPPNAAVDWSFTVRGAVEREVSWSWEELLALPRETVTVDIHCVTQWTKLDTTWTGVSLDTLLADAGPRDAGFAVAHAADGYETNLPLADLTGRRAWLVWEAGAAVSGRLTWRTVTVLDVREDTPRVRTITLDVPGLGGHRAGQSVDVRLTAADGYRTQRPYSIASAPEDEAFESCVEHLETGEVSPWLAGELRAGDRFELDAPALAAAGPARRVCVCGPTAFVEHATRLALEVGHDAAHVRAERFGGAT